jgi:hypothetical protein
MHKRYCYFIMGDECGLLDVRHPRRRISGPCAALNAASMARNLHDHYRAA